VSGRNAHPDRILLPETRAVLPRIQRIEFNGSSAYLEDLVARIDTPRLDLFPIQYLDRLDFQVPHLSEFVDRLNRKLFQFGDAVVYFQLTRGVVSFAFRHENKLRLDPFPLVLESSISIYISGEGIDQQVSRMTLVLSQTSAMLADVVHLVIGIGIEVDGLESNRQDSIGNIAWLEHLRPFTAVKTLRVPEVLAGSVALALEGIIGEKGIQMLPSVD